MHFSGSWKPVAGGLHSKAISARNLPQHFSMMASLLAQAGFLGGTGWSNYSLRGHASTRPRLASGEGGGGLCGRSGEALGQSQRRWRRRGGGGREGPGGGRRHRAAGPAAAAHPHLQWGLGGGRHSAGPAGCRWHHRLGPAASTAQRQAGGHTGESHNCPGVSEARPAASSVKR